MYYEHYLSVVKYTKDINWKNTQDWIESYEVCNYIFEHWGHLSLQTPAPNTFSNCDSLFLSLSQQWEIR